MPVTINGSTGITDADGGTVLSSADISSQAQAEAGTDNATVMTPLRVDQHTVATNLGWGQTWQDVTGSRATLTSYQNTTGRPISVAIRGVAGGSTVQNFEASVNNSTWIGVGALHPSTSSSISAVIPNNWYYRLNASAPTISFWSELR